MCRVEVVEAQGLNFAPSKTETHVARAQILAGSGQPKPSSSGTVYKRMRRS